MYANVPMSCRKNPSVSANQLNDRSGSSPQGCMLSTGARSSSNKFILLVRYHNLQTDSRAWLPPPASSEPYMRVSLQNGSRTPKRTLLWSAPATTNNIVTFAIRICSPLTITVDERTSREAVICFPILKGSPNYLAMEHPSEVCASFSRSAYQI